MKNGIPTLLCLSVNVDKRTITLRNVSDGLRILLEIEQPIP